MCIRDSRDSSQSESICDSSSSALFTPKHGVAYPGLGRGAGINCAGHTRSIALSQLCFIGPSNMAPDNLVMFELMSIVRCRPRINEFLRAHRGSKYIARFVQQRMVKGLYLPVTSTCNAGSKCGSPLVKEEEGKSFPTRAPMAGLSSG